VQLLLEAIQKGYKDIDSLKNNPDFESLRSREDFRKILE
jgi:hypothetical protein